MKPKSIAEQMLFNTVRLVASDGATGTGFFFRFKFSDGIVPILITNKHVVNDNPYEEMKFLLHLESEDGESSESMSVTYQSTWIFHPDYDLCFTYAGPLFEEVKQRTGKDVFYVGNEEDLIYSKEKLLELSALEEITMVGYPNGLWDIKNNFPIFRKGFTASHPAFDFNEKGISLADIACFPGSSGSPIYILNENSYSDKNGNIFMGKSRVIFLGVLFAGPTMNADGEISIIDIPTQQRAITNTRLMINLGYYIKAEAILDFREIIRTTLEGKDL